MICDLPASWALEVAISLLIFFVGHKPKSLKLNEALFRYGMAVFCVILFCLPYWWFVYLFELAVEVQSEFIKAFKGKKKPSLKLCLSVYCAAVMEVFTRHQRKRFNFLSFYIKR